MSRLGHIADLENINPVSGLLSYQSRQDGKVQLSTQGSKDAHAAALKWPARRPLSDVTAHFTFQLGRVEEVNALRAHTLFPGKPTEPRQLLALPLGTRWSIRSQKRVSAALRAGILNKSLSTVTAAKWLSAFRKRFERLCNPKKRIEAMSNRGRQQLQEKQ
eukprot:gene32528-17242_t